MMHFIDNKVGWRLYHRTLVVSPSIGIRFTKVSHHAKSAVHSDSLGKNAN